MISRSLLVEGLEGPAYRHLLELLDPPEGDKKESTSAARGGLLGRLSSAVSESSEATPREELPPRDAKGALVLLRQGRCERILSLGHGRPRGEGWRRQGGSWSLPTESLEEVSPIGLSRLRKGQDLAFAVAVNTEALPELLADLGRQQRGDDDPVAQALRAAKRLQRALGRELWLSPRLLGSLPLPPYELWAKSFDRMLPDGHTVMFYVLSEGRCWSSVILRKRAGDIDLISSQAALEAQLRVRSLKDIPAARQLVERRYGRPHLCLAVSLSSWRRFVGGDRSALARALATKQAILDPAPAWVHALIGAAAVSEAASRSARLAGKLLSRSPLGGLLGKAPERIAGKLANPLEGLGVDPWELLAVGRSWSRRTLPLLMKR